MCLFSWDRKVIKNIATATKTETAEKDPPYIFSHRKICLIVGIPFPLLFTESYYSIKQKKQVLWKNFSLITGIQLLFLFAAHFLPFLLVGVRSFTWIRYILFAGELGGGLVLLVIALHSSSRNIAVGTFKEKNKLT